jgi:hypothetical protein
MRGLRARLLPLVIFMLLGLCAAFAASTGGTAANLVANGGFEDEELGSVAMWSTSAWVPTDDAVRFFVTSDAKHGGSRSFAIANLSSTEMVVVRSLPPAPSGEQRPNWLQRLVSFRWLRALFTPSWLYLVVTMLSLLVLAAIVVAVFALASALVTRRYGPAVAALSGRIPITALISGFSSRAPRAGRPRGGRRRGAAHEIEHRSWRQIPLDTPITVKRRRKDAGVDTFRLRTVNACEGGLFLASEDISLLGLDDELSLEVLRESVKVELGRAYVVRAGKNGFGLRFGSPNARIRQMLSGLS